MASVLADRIRAARDEILAEWQAGVRTLASAARAPDHAVFDSVPDFLDWLIERLGADADDGDRDAFGEHHALERLHQGFDVVEVIAELSLLRECLLAVWERAPEGITPAEVRQLDAEVDHVVALVVVSFVRGLGEGTAAEPPGAAASP